MNYIKQHPVSFALAAVFILSFGVTTFFLSSANRDLRKENREMRKQNKQYEQANKALSNQVDSLVFQVDKRNELIEKSTVVYDSIQKKLIQLNDKKIVTNFPTHNTISTLDLDAQIELLSRFIGAADSIGR